MDAVNDPFQLSVLKVREREKRKNHLVKDEFASCYCRRPERSLEEEDFLWQHNFPSINSFWGKFATLQLIRGHRWKQKPQSIIIIPARWRPSWKVNSNGNKTKSFTTKIPSEKLLQCLALWILPKRNDFSCCRLLAITPAKFYTETSRTACWSFNRGWLWKKKYINSTIESSSEMYHDFQRIQYTVCVYFPV